MTWWSRLLRHDRPAVCRGVWVPVRGGSMAPLLRPRDQVLVEFDAPTERLCCGAIVVVARHSGLIVHRIVAVRSTAHRVEVVTKGDAVATADWPVNRERVLGVVVGARRRRWGRWHIVEVDHAVA